MSQSKAPNKHSALVAPAASVAPTALVAPTASAAPTAAAQDPDELPALTMHRFLGGQGRKIVLAEVSPDRTRAVLRSNLDEECVLRVWDVANQVFVGALVAQGQPVYSIAISHDNKRVVTGSEDCLIRVWDLGSLRALPRAAPAADHANAHRRRAAPFPDHSLLPSVGLLSAHADHRSVVNALVFDPRSSTRWLTASEDHTARLYEAEGGRYVCAALLKGHEDAVTTAAFHPTQRDVFCTASLDLTVRIWTRSPATAAAAGAAGTARAAVLHILSNFRAAVFSVAFSPDGRRLLTAGLDKAVWLWEVPVAAPGNGEKAARVLAVLDASACAGRNLLVAWSQPDGEHALVASNDTCVVWAGLLRTPARPQVVARQPAPGDVPGHGVLRAARFLGAGVFLVFNARRYAKQPPHSPADADGCALVEHVNVRPLRRQRAGLRTTVRSVLRAGTGWPDVPRTHGGGLAGLVLELLLGA